MYPKKKIINLINAIAHKAAGALKLSSWTIDWYVLNSKNLSEHQKDLNLRIDKNCVACSFSDSIKKFGIICVFYDRCTSKTDCIGSIVHELLHVKFRKLVDKYKISDRNEEMMVRDIESLILQFYKESVKDVANQ